jgi:hypothetical protein
VSLLCLVGVFFCSSGCFSSVRVSAVCHTFARRFRQRSSSLSKEQNSDWRDEPQQCNSHPQCSPNKSPYEPTQKKRDQERRPFQTGHDRFLGMLSAILDVLHDAWRQGDTSACLQRSKGSNGRWTGSAKLHDLPNCTTNSSKPARTASVTLAPTSSTTAFSAVTCGAMYSR